jgi:DNA-binding GntR family transcriptional regulator
LSPTQRTNKHTRIELIFDLIADKSTDKKALKLKVDHQTFLHYANKFKSAQDVKYLIETEWLKVLTGFQYLNEWYENDRLYHLIGYLIGQKYKTIQDIWIVAQGCKQDEFEAKLKKLYPT